MLAEIACAVTDAPWTLSPEHRDRARRAGLSDDEIVHAVALSSFFGHLNRIADAVGVALDYEVRHLPPRAEPSVPSLERAPSVGPGSAALTIESRPATAAALTAWRDYLVARDPINLRIAAHVAELLGDGAPVAEPERPDSPVDAQRSLVEEVTLAPWRLGQRSFAALRAVGHDDAALFDICAAASSFGVFSRIRVALGALGG
jgi:hypothetical protein